MSVNLKIRNIFQFAFSLLLMAGLSSCIMDTGFDEPGEMTSATLRLSTRSSVTRADGKDELEKDPYAENEDKIGRVALFFYTDGKSTSAPFFVTELNVEEIVSADVVVTIPEELVTGSNFPGNKAYAYALANLPADVRIDAADGKISVGSGAPKAATMEALQALWVGNPGFVSASAPATFVMRGGGEIALQEDATTGARTASGTILLERLASKIRLWADIPGYLYIDTTTGKTIDENASDFQAKKDDDKIEKWESVPVSGDESNVNLYLYNLTQRGRIDGYVGARIDDPEDPENLAYANIENAAKGARKLAENVRLNDADKDETYTYSHETAYYSYPNVWDGDSPSEQHRTHVVISVPWRRVEGGDTEYRECYYSVPVNALTATTDNGKAEKANCLEPNCYYRIKVRIGMLGNTNRGEAIEIPASYEVVPWSTANVDVNIKDRRFLVVNQKEWVMNNTYTLEIPFATSHKTIIEACYVTYFRYYEPWGTDRFATEAWTLQNDREGVNNGIYANARWHDRTEFQNWCNAANSAGVQNTEGVIRADIKHVDPVTDKELATADNLMLYYKREYFYDDIIGDFTYYVGHEQPKTFQHGMITIEEAEHGGLTEDSEEWNAWKQYNEKYDKINAIYTCEIDSDKRVINFKHPLILWKEVRDESGTLKYYAPDLNPRTHKLWDEYSRVEISIIIKHEDWKNNDGLYREIVHITQYPAMYVEVSHNYANPVGFNNTNVNEYVSVNGLNVSPNANPRYGNPLWTGTALNIRSFAGNNNNPNMYVIHTSQLSEENEHLYDIGDPRSLHYNNLLTNESFKDFIKDVDNPEGILQYGVHTYTSGFWPPTNRTDRLTEDIFSSTRLYSPEGQTLQYYYPTDETDGAGSKENFIAPSFRIASSFGKANFHTLNDNVNGYTHYIRNEARFRCATYQEAGRPAGRWRVPTKAEIKYLVQLSVDKKIPALFGNPMYPTTYASYYSASGILGVRSSDNDIRELTEEEASDYYLSGTMFPPSIAVRCIYDEWYWTQIDGTNLPTPNGVKETTFYWGDVKKDNTQELPNP